jgi:hypothetical protein
MMRRRDFPLNAIRVIRCNATNKETFQGLGQTSSRHSPAGGGAVDNINNGHFLLLLVVNKKNAGEH